MRPETLLVAGFPPPSHPLLLDLALNHQERVCGWRNTSNQQPGREAQSRFEIT